MSETIEYVDRSDIHEGKLDELTAAIEGLASFVEEHNPRILDYRIFLDVEARRMTVVAVHPDAEALELHLEVGKEEFRRVGTLIELRSIDVFGRPSEIVMRQLRDKAAMLGEHGTVTVHEPSAGFTRLSG